MISKIPVIIDTDPGIDDLVAIMLANSSDKLDIRAITSVAGNQTLDKTSQNLLDISRFLNLGCKIARGAEKPLNKPLYTAQYVHGESGLGNLKLEHINGYFDNDYAWDVIYNEAKILNGKLKLITIGPLTNVAIAILKYPDLKDYLDSITIMGGSCHLGNVTLNSEYNIWCDPFAADIVFKSNIPITMVGLDVTMKALIYKNEIDSLCLNDSSVTTIMENLLTYLYDIYINFGVNGVALHDALAVAYLINSDILKCKDYYVTIETRGNLNLGRTVVDLDNSHRDKTANVSVAIDVNREAFINILKDMMGYYKK